MLMCIADISVPRGQVPHLQPFPAPHSLLVLDNCSTYHNAAFLQLIENTGAKILFLPPYSPELIPVSPCLGCAHHDSVG